jgi:hypothetical protein
MLGCTCIGHVIGRGPLGVEAFDVDDKSRGLFRTQGDAADVLAQLMLDEAPQ